jgi:site-specific DNA-cytosine methylase
MRRQPNQSKKTKKKTKEFRFIDLFCGIGGFRIASRDVDVLYKTIDVVKFDG